MIPRKFILTGILAAAITPGSWAADPAQTISPKVDFIPAPLKPSVMPPEGPSVLAGFSAFYCGKNGGMENVPDVYQPIREGGFRIKGSSRRLNRPIINGQNRFWTGDVPLFRMDTFAGPELCLLANCAPKPVPLSGKHSLGTFRLGVRTGKSQILWLETLSKDTTVSYFPGYTDYQIEQPEWKASIRVATVDGMHGMICRVEFDREMPLVWQFSDVVFDDPQSVPAELAIKGRQCRITDPDIANVVVLAGWDGEGNGRLTEDKRRAEFSATQSRKLYHVVANWGITAVPEGLLEKPRKNLMQSPAARAWPENAEKLWRSWQDCYVNPALNPDENFRALLSAPATALEKAVERWTARRNEFQIATPDAHLDAVVNWTRAASDYHVQGPSMYLGAISYCWYAHTSVGWYGKEWAGDHAQMDHSLRLYATTQTEKDGWIGWLGWAMRGWHQENNTPYWVDQVWQHYRWTGDRRFVRELWPTVRKAVAWECKQHDFDNDGIFTSNYPYWNSDSYAAMSKAASPTATGYAMLDAAARLAEVVEDTQAAAEYRTMAEKTKAAALRELWDETSGLYTSVGSDGLCGSHPNSWEVTQAVNYGLLDAARGRRAMRWIESHYGFEGARPDVRLIMTSDLWPLRWSNHWVATGDTFLNGLAGMKCGDVDLWWPYLNTAVHSNFRNKSPGIRFAINNMGMGDGDRDDVDSDDPFPHTVVRGLFGIEPAIHEGALLICPAFPKDWKEASIKTPDVSYEYQRNGETATFRIRTPRPLVKYVRANFMGKEVVTVSETESVVTVPVGTPLPEPPRSVHPKTILVNREPKLKPAPLPAEERKRLIMVDLGGAFNICAEELMNTPMLFDNRQMPVAATAWWVNPAISMPPTPRLIEAENGVTFLTAGRPEGVEPAKAPKSLVALSSWRPYPWPAGVNIAIGRKCERLWLLLQNYVHPSKCYLPNGEVVLRYTDGKQAITSLVPPYNLDAFYQISSRQGIPVLLGTLDFSAYKGRYSPATMDYAERITACHAMALEIQADPKRVLESVELRATCSEGILGLVGMTLCEAKYNH